MAERDTGSEERYYETGAERHYWAKDAFNIVKAEQVVEFRERLGVRKEDPLDFPALVERVWSAYQVRTIMEDDRSQELRDSECFKNIVAGLHRTINDLDFVPRAQAANAYFYESLLKLFKGKKAAKFVEGLKLLFGFIVAKGDVRVEIEEVFMENMSAIEDLIDGVCVRVDLPVPQTNYKMILVVDSQGELVVAFDQINKTS